MDQSLIKLLKRENKKITKLRFQLGWWGFIVFSITYTLGMVIISFAAPESAHYWLCFWIGFILLIFSIVFFFYFNKALTTKVNIKLKANSEKDYTKQVIKENLISHGYYHLELLETLVTTFESKNKDKINAALLITLIIFVVSPTWNLILDTAYKNSQQISIIFILTFLMIGIVFFSYLVIKAFISYKYSLDNYMITQLKEISTECLFEKINKGI
ncbi:hypothetical protein ACPDKE_000477 [Listeria monocytogenes]